MYCYRNFLIEYILRFEYGSWNSNLKWYLLTKGGKKSKKKFARHKVRSDSPENDLVDLVDPDETQVATADSDVKPRKIAKGLFDCISLVTKTQMQNLEFLCFGFLLLLSLFEKRR
jgi:hypothetical protein